MDGCGSGRGLLRQRFDCLVEDRILGGRCLAEIDVGLRHRDVGREALVVDRDARGGEVDQVREQEARAVGQPHELLSRGAAERALADDRRPLVAGERRREHFRARPTCRCR